MSKIKLGSLFDGIGVFPLAAAHVGIEAIWASEVAKVPISITKHHFPNMLHLGDIIKLDGGKIPPVDIITFGSPCQDLSIAGNRKGLSGEKSRLFYEAIRIIREMRENTNGRFPVFAIWENVTGAFSSNQRMDFQAVLEAFTEEKIPMPIYKKWCKAGMVRTDRVDLAWRVLDAQYWGVPQRRKRIFLVADFGGERSTKILFRPEKMPAISTICKRSRVSATERNRISIEKTKPLIFPLQERKIRQCAKNGRIVGYLRGFGKATDPFPTLLTSNSIFALYDLDNPERGYLRYLTPIECERLMGLPDNWTFYGTEGKEHSDCSRYQALGNSIVLPCAEYIMSGMKEVLSSKLEKKEN